MEQPQSVKVMKHEGLNKDQGGEVSKTPQSKIHELQSGCSPLER